jgi:FMN phosphatase YigB (HAD superfamily)
MELSSYLKLVIFDLDDTLHFYDLTQMPAHVKDILNFFKRHHVPIAMASLNLHAYEYLCYYNVQKYFKAVEARKCKSQIRTYEDYREYIRPTKKYMLRRLLKKFSCTPQEVLFFDDIVENIQIAKSMGINSVHVDDRFCIRWKDVFEGMQYFKLRPIPRRRTTDF